MALNQSYDRTLKNLFSHPAMIAGLIETFGAEPWIKELDFSTLRRLNTEHITQDLKMRQSDLIWQISWREKELNLVCLVEFQSKIDFFMPVRISTYVGLIYQDLIKHKKLHHITKKLPPIWVLVFYTGKRAWNVPTNLKGCLDHEHIPPELIKYQPDIAYFIIDTNRIDLKSITTKDNLVVLLIQLEQANHLYETLFILEKVVNKLENQSTELQRAVCTYMERILGLPERSLIFIWEIGGTEMLPEKIRRMKQEVYQEGKIEGKMEGLKDSIIRLLNSRYGSVPSVYGERLQKDKYEDLSQWFDELLEATFVDQ